MSSIREDLSIFNKFNFERPPVGVKFLSTKPDGIERLDKILDFCEMPVEAQNGSPFYVAKEDFTCIGPLLLGMVDSDPIFQSGQVGPKLEVFKEARANRRIYQFIPKLAKDTVNYVAFSPLDKLSFEPLRDEVRLSGIPAKIWRRGEYVSFQEFAKVESFHHYCKPEVPVATQCCTFEMKKAKSSWMANYGEELYEPIKKLIKSLEHEINEDFKIMSQWFVAGEMGTEFMDLSFYYPVLIFQGDVYAAYVNNNDLTFKKCKHVQFNPEFFSFYDNDIISYHIDIITEEYLKPYLKIIDLEMLTVKKQLEKQKNEILLSIGKIVEECRSFKKKPTTYRKYLEFDRYR